MVSTFSCVVLLERKVSWSEKEKLTSAGRTWRLCVFLSAVATKSCINFLVVVLLFLVVKNSLSVRIT